MNADTYARIVDLTVKAMAEEGFGSPPVAFDVIVMGSGARNESMIYPDQDNGFILADHAPSDHSEVDGWFTELAGRMTQGLDAVGIPLCTGYVMATNPLWRKSLADWKAQIGYWSERRSPNLLRHTEILSDFVPVWGERRLSADLRNNLMSVLQDNDPMLCGIGRSAGVHGPALTWLGGFITVRQPQAYRGSISMKHHGTLPVVSGARLMALRSGIAETSTLERLDRLMETGFFRPDRHDELVAAYRLSARTLLNGQIAAFSAGREVTSFISPGGLTRRQRRSLKQAFKIIREFYDRIRFEFAVEI